MPTSSTCRLSLPLPLRRLLMGLLLLLSGAAMATTPRYIVYYNADASPASDLIGLPYSHVILSFLTLDARSASPLKLVVDQRMVEPLVWVARLQADGKKVMVSFGGGDMALADYRAAVGQEAELAKQLAAFVQAHGLDGVDLDFEVTPALEQPPRDGAFDGRAFLVALTKALREELPAGALISHAPQAPYLDPNWHQGPYLDILQRAGTAIDWITVQYYNNPDFDLPVATHLVGAANKPFAASYAGITAQRPNNPWPSHKTVVGLPIYKADASNGHLAPEVVRDQVLGPLVARYDDGFGGLAGWQFSTLTADHRFWNGPLAVALHQAKAGESGAHLSQRQAHTKATGCWFTDYFQISRKWCEPNVIVQILVALVAVSVPLIVLMFQTWAKKKRAAARQSNLLVAVKAELSYLVAFYNEAYGFWNDIDNRFARHMVEKYYIKLPALIATPQVWVGVLSDEDRTALSALVTDIHIYNQIVDEVDGVESRPSLRRNRTRVCEYLEKIRLHIENYGLTVQPWMGDHDE